MRFDAVLWDMDGTLVDSEPLHEETLVATLVAEGITPPAEMHQLVVGSPTQRIHQIFQDRYGLKAPFLEWCRRRYEHYLRLAPSLRPCPGAMELFRALDRHGIRQAVVSNSDRLIVDANLRAVGICEPELVTVSRNDVRLGKPEAECYRRALWLLNCAPDRAVAIEDSVTGVLAGLAAGVTTIFVPLDPDSQAPDGAMQFNSLSDVHLWLMDHLS